MKGHFFYFLLGFYLAYGKPTCHEKIEELIAKDETVVYSECFDYNHVLVFYSTYPDVLFFVDLGDSGVKEIDSILDFNHGFLKYHTEAEMLERMGETEIEFKEKVNMQISYGFNRKYQLKNPILGNFAKGLFIVDDYHIYKLSLSGRRFEKIISYHLSMDIRGDCSDSNRTQLAIPQKVISLSAIKVNFQDGTEFVLSPDGALNVNVSDNSCLSLKGTYNDIRIDLVQGDGCNRSIPLCD